MQMHSLWVCNLYVYHLSLWMCEHNGAVPHSLVHAACSSIPRGGALEPVFWQWTLSVTGAKLTKLRCLKRVILH